MTHILLPTDFSEGSLHASAYAIRLLGVKDNDFILVHTFMDPNVGNGMWPGVGSEFYQVSVDALLSWTQRLLALPEIGAAQVRQEVEYGALPFLLNELVGRYDAEMVAMGSQGSSHSEFLGSTAVQVLKQSKVPVLVVPSAAIDGPLMRILLADDGKVVARPSLEPVLRLARQSGAEVVIAHVLQHAEELPDADVAKVYAQAFQGIKHSFITGEGKDAAAALDHLVKQEGADLVVLRHRHTDLFEALFHTSTSKRFVLHSKVPMLVLEDSKRSKG